MTQRCIVYVVFKIITNNVGSSLWVHARGGGFSRWKCHLKDGVFAVADSSSVIKLTSTAVPLWPSVVPFWPPVVPLWPPDRCCYVIDPQL